MVLFPSRVTHRMYAASTAVAVILAPALAVVAHAAGSSGGNGAFIGNVTIHEILADYDWGYWCGVKQPLGSYKDGWSIHQLSDSNCPVAELEANPDYILWVNENDGSYGISERPTNMFHGNVRHPGGQVAFGADGTIWYTYGGRAVDLPLDLYMSTSPFNVDDFILRLDNYETYQSSTTPCLHVHNPYLHLIWRHGWSSGVDTTVRFRRYHIGYGFANYELELDIGKGCDDPEFGQMGIEQLYTRFDPRFEYHFVTWQWWDYQGPFGSSPFVYSDDEGDTWRTADGQALANLPVTYTDRTDVLVPYDHIALGENSAWNVRDLGVSPNGTFWITLPKGNGVPDEQWWLWFWRFDGTQWQGEQMTGPMLGHAKPHACGATKDHLVLVYSEFATKNELKARFSADDGVTWSAPVTIDTLGPGDAVTWVSFVQPADGYEDNTARFFYACYQFNTGWVGRWYLNRYRWVSLDVLPGAIEGDVNGDGVVDVQDLLAVLGAWGPCAGCPEDINGDGAVDVLDLLILLSAWSADA